MQSHLQCPFHVDFFVLFAKKEIGTWWKDVLFNIINNPIYIVAAIEEFTNIIEDEAVSAFNGFFNYENDCDIFFCSNSLLCVAFLGRIVCNDDEEEMNVPPLGVL